MRINYRVSKRIRELKNLKVPRQGRETLIEVSTGICSLFTGSRMIIDKSIQYAQKNKLYGIKVLELIDTQLKEHFKYLKRERDSPAFPINSNTSL